MLRRISAVLVVALCFLPLLQGQTHAKPKRAGRATPGATMPLTTSSVKALDLYKRAVENSENLHMDRAQIGWRAAAKEDPKFAMAFAMLALSSRDPEEVRVCRERAKELAAGASAGEKLMIQWIAGTQEGNDLAGIAAMNDLLAMFPHDKHLHFFAANWLMGKQNREQAGRLLHKALEIDPDFAPALNDLAYVYARDRDFDAAFQAMERYVKLLPKEPNPQDSYAEILRMAGRFEAALEHYRAALAIDSSFNSSQAGLGDTYALMGDQEQARKEYDKAIQQEPDLANRYDYLMQKATTWVREKRYVEADREFWRVAAEAHAQSYDLQEAQALRRMAQYQADNELALERLASAEESLERRHNLSASIHDEELARVLRLRVARSMRAGKEDAGRAALGRLEQMAASGRNRVIQLCWHGAAGEMLMAQGKFKDAISELEEDQDNPGTLGLLVEAYREVGASEKQRSAEERLRTTNLPTLEQALSVTGFPAKAAKL
ncbi:MAG: tetratricopeptide repeat protein [Terriglobales bacterium]